MSGRKKTNRKKTSTKAKASRRKGAAPVRPANPSLPLSAALPPAVERVTLSNPARPAFDALVVGDADNLCAPRGNGCRTNYFVEAQGSLKPDGGHLLFINGVRIKIQWLQFILLLILGSHARAKAGYPAPVDVLGGDFLQPARIAEIIDKLKDGAMLCAGRSLPACANHSDAKAIHNAKHRLLNLFEEKGIDAALLDDGDGAGYQLSTLPGRIKLRLVDPAGDVVFDWVL